MLRPLCLLLVIAMCPLRAAVAWATPAKVVADSAETQAREMFRRAEVHFNLREFDRAMELYREAYRLTPLPGFLFNIAQCHRFSRRYEDAAFSYRVYLQRAPNAVNRSEVEELVRMMDARALDARSPDAKPSQFKAEAAPPAGNGATLPGVVESSGPSATEETPGVSAWVWGMGAVGVTLLGAGVVTGQMASDRSERYNSMTTPRDELAGLRDSGRALATTSVITLSAGAVALLTAGALWLYAPPRQPQANVGAGKTVALAASPTSDGGAWFGLQGGF